MQPTTPRAPITPRAPPSSRGSGDDGFLTARSQKRAPTGPVESSTEDEMVFEKHVRSGSGGKRSRKNGLQVYPVCLGFVLLILCVCSKIFTLRSCLLPILF